MAVKQMTDPVELVVRDALEAAGQMWVDETDPRSLGLDFYLPLWGVHIEVKRMHSDRIAEQTSRAPDVIVIQGMEAAKMFAKLLSEVPYARDQRRFA